MPEVVELYRHPVKSFTPERVETLRVVDGRVVGDRVLGFRFADKGPVDDWSWQTKHNFVALVNTPGMALLETSFDDESRILSLNYDGEAFAEGSIDSEEDRFDLAEAVGEFVSSLEDNPLVGHPERVPLKLVGDGRAGMFHDTTAGGVTLYSNESLKALSVDMGFTESPVDGRRFRTNVVIEGVSAWSELSWPDLTNGQLRIGDFNYEVAKPVTRCLATHANPVSGERDAQIMPGLVSANGIPAPTFAVQLFPENVEPGAEVVINVGDSITINK